MFSPMCDKHFCRCDLDKIRRHERQITVLLVCPITTWQSNDISKELEVEKNNFRLIRVRLVGLGSEHFTDFRQLIGQLLNEELDVIAASLYAGFSFSRDRLEGKLLRYRN